MTLILSFASCRTSQWHTKTEYIHIHDSIVTVDTVIRVIHVSDYQQADSVLKLFEDALLDYDSLLDCNANKDSLLLAYAKMLIVDKNFNTDTISACTDFACAYAAIVASELQLWIEQNAIDTTLLLEQLNIKVKDKTVSNQVEEKTIVVTKPFYRTFWFWCTLVLVAIIVIYVFFKVIITYVKTS